MINYPLRVFLFCLLLPAFSLAQHPSQKQVKLWQQQASRVTIVRDSWGLPHIYGKTDADCVFGLAYAQAEDNMEQVEDNFIRSIGRGAEVHGAESLVSDQFVHAMELEAISKQEYFKAPATMRSLYDSYAAGLNYYLYKNKEYHPALLHHFEPWYPLACVRHFYYYNDILQNAGVNPEDLKENFKPDPDTHATGSNAWVIGKGKTNNGSSMLFLNPHRAVFGNGTFTEAHIESETGWKFSGATKFGFPLLYMGHNGNIGYGYTVNYADLGDQYIETFDHPSDPLLYRYGSSYKRATRWKKTILVKEGSQTTARVYQFLKTHHGPVLKTIQGRPVAVRLAGWEKTGWLEEWYNMSKAHDLVAFKKAMSPLAMPYLNVLYGDKAGNIYFLYNLAMPKRNSGFDFVKPVEGADPRTEWGNYHSLGELPQLTNPASGFLQSCNSDIAFTAGDGSIHKNDYPAYMIGIENKNPRAARSLAILENNHHISFEKWSSLVTDAHCQLADDSLQIILPMLEQALEAQPQKKELLSPLVQTLQQWDGNADTRSVGMTLFREMINYHRGDGSPFWQALEKAKTSLEKNWGRWQVQWGERSRLQWIGWDEQEKFSDQKPSFPLPGAPQGYGTMFCNIFGNSKAQQTPSDAKLRYLTAGNTYSSVIELGNTVRAGSIMPFGQQETGPHSQDQTALFIEGKFKEAWFYKKDVLAHAERSYHPGE